MPEYSVFHYVLLPHQPTNAQAPAITIAQTISFVRFAGGIAPHVLRALPNSAIACAAPPSAVVVSVFTNPATPNPSSANPQSRD